MEKEMLRKVQNELLEIAIEIKRVCEKNNIQFFLHGGTLLGAVRHHGFIPWDDDIDISMLRDDYEKWNSIAARDLGENYYWQTWENEDGYPLPFGKVRKRNTIYLEGKAKMLKENGFFVDVFPLDYAPISEKDRVSLQKGQSKLFKMLLMQCKWKPWMINNKLNMKVYIYYLWPKLCSMFSTREALIMQYDYITKNVGNTQYVYEHLFPKYYNIEWFADTVKCDFEGVEFPAMKNYSDYLSVTYGDYMKLPPENERENRHSIEMIIFDD